MERIRYSKEKKEMTIVWPIQNTKFVDWASSLRQLRPDLEINPRVDDEKAWREWGNSLVQSQECQTINSPSTEGFKSWQEWAIAFIKSFGPNA